MTVSEDLILYILDQDPQLVFSEIRSKGCEPVAIAICLCYGKDLPAGREWGTRDQRRTWLASERAKCIRRTVAELAIQATPTEKDLMRLYRAVVKRRGYGPVVKGLIQGWHEVHGSSKMEVV